MPFPYRSTQPDETDEDRRLRGRAIFHDLSVEAVALKHSDPLMFSLLNVKARTLNRLFGLGTKSEHQQGSVLALEDMVGVIDEEIEWVKKSRD